jgi:HEAT repeat protein
MTNHQWRALAIAGHTGDETTARDALTHDDPVARELALAALDRLGVLTDDEVRTALGDPEMPVRRRSVLIAASRPSIDLLASLRDPATEVAEAAAWAAGEHAEVDDTVLTELVALAGEADDPLVREAAVAALGAIGDERGLGAILQACTDKPAIRRRAVLALAPFEGPEVDLAIAAARTDRDWQVRQAADDIAPTDD